VVLSASSVAFQPHQRSGRGCRGTFGWRGTGRDALRWSNTSSCRSISGHFGHRDP